MPPISLFASNTITLPIADVPCMHMPKSQNRNPIQNFKCWRWKSKLLIFLPLVIPKLAVLACAKFTISHSNRPLSPFPPPLQVLCPEHKLEHFVLLICYYLIFFYGSVCNHLVYFPVIEPGRCRNRFFFSAHRKGTASGL